MPGREIPLIALDVVSRVLLGSIGFMLPSSRKADGWNKARKHPAQQCRKTKNFVQLVRPSTWRSPDRPQEPSSLFSIIVVVLEEIIQAIRSALPAGWIFFNRNDYPFSWDTSASQQMLRLWKRGDKPFGVQQAARFLAPKLVLFRGAAGQGSLQPTTQRHCHENGRVGPWKKDGQ